VALEEVSPDEWRKKGYRTDTEKPAGTLKKPDTTLAHLRIKTSLHIERLALSLINSQNI
jgi:hypothetical protein